MKCRIWLAGVLGTALGTWSYYSTKKKQKKAKEDGLHRPFGVYEACFKRPLDVVLATGLLVFLSPTMLATALTVRIKLGKPVFFKQNRPGKDGRIFTLRKFRTMTVGDGADEERLTDFGKKLRSTSLDELPELFNVIRGEMSLIGPRPLLTEYLPLYTKRQLHRHDVRPGLTGLAQVSGRNELPWDERFEYDLNYVRRITFLGDVKILIKTVAIIIKKKGISSKTSETMEVFTGSRE